MVDGERFMPDAIELRATEVMPGGYWVAGKYLLRFSGSGNLELWNTITRRVLWQSGTRGLSVARMVMQEDGNLVIYDQNKRAIWESGTHGNDAAYLKLQNDGNVVIYSQDDRPLWDTCTRGH
jgi:hypothetical protein